MIALHELRDRFKMSKKAIKQTKEIILYHLLDYFDDNEPTEELIKIHDEWADYTYAEMVENSKGIERDMFSDFMEDLFNVNIDEEGFDFDDPESFKRLQEKLQNQKSNSQKESKRKKTKKQLEKEKIELAKVALETKNMRAIYIALSKVLHPDSETNADLKKVKEEEMKNLVEAYKQKDLSTLLKLEMQWLKPSNEHLSELPEDKLEVYVKVLRDRVNNLKEDLERMYYHPRCASIVGFVRMPEKAALGAIQTEKNSIVIQNIMIEENIEIVEGLESKKEMNEVLTEIFEEILEDQEMEFGGLPWFDDSFF